MSGSGVTTATTRCAECQHARMKHRRIVTSRISRGAWRNAAHFSPHLDGHGRCRVRACACVGFQTPDGMIIDSGWL